MTRLQTAVLLLAVLGCRPAAPAEPWRFAEVPAALVAPHVMAASDHPLASEVAARIMARGGNAIDAIVALAFAESAVNPIAGNIGGGGFLVYRQATGDVFALDFREMAPLAATADMYVDSAGNVTDESVLGPKAAGVPGSVAGLWAMHQRFGALRWKDVVTPAVRLAEAHVLDEDRARWLASEKLGKFPSSRAVFGRHDRPWQAGDTLRQPDLARTLALIAAGGADAFYRGPIAKQVAQSMRESGGLISEQDLARYRPEWRTPLEGNYRGWHVITMPPVSGGGATLLQALNILEGFTVPAWDTAALVHVQVEALRRGFLDRNRFLGDPAFVEMPIARLTSKEYAREQAASIVVKRATPLTGSVLAEGRHTTHYSVVDSSGNAAALTTTLNTGYGSGFVVAGAGFLLNNEMDDFTTLPGTVNAMGIQHVGVANSIAPGKRMLSSMTPTIVLNPSGQLELVLGSEGGAAIISAVLQVIVHVVDHGMTLAEAVAAPRIHHNGLPDLVGWEPHGLSPATRRRLDKMGYVLWKEPDYMCTLNAIRVTPAGLEGMPDPRVMGGAAGW